MITREHYIEEIREFYDSDLIKIITGIWRSGKSIILQQIMDEVRAKSKKRDISKFRGYGFGERSIKDSLAKLEEYD